VPNERSVFRTSAELSGLITREQIEEAVRAIREDPSGPPTPVVDVTDDLLADYFTRQGILTSYQADQLKAGRTKLTLGPYLVTDFIGQGGMGQVFKAVHEMMGREVAVKVLPVTRATPESIRNFSHEIRTQAKLDHPNLVRAYDAGHDGNVYYLVTEYVPGTDLRRLVRTQGRLTVQQAAKAIMQSALGLQHAHESGLIHRDVKPGNILVTPEGKAKVSDLGLAGFLNDPDQDPRAGKVVGTADYLSPEQILSPMNITAASDIYSLGCTAYYAVTGKVPYPGGTTREKAQKHCDKNVNPIHPRNFNPDVPEEFVELMADMMEKDPAHRIESAAEVARRLKVWAEEATPLPSPETRRSAWMSPAVPTGSEERSAPIIETGSASEYLIDLHGQASENSGSVGDTSRIHETRRIADGRRKPPLPITHTTAVAASTRKLAYALAIAIPLSMIAGALIMFAVMKIFG